MNRYIRRLFVRFETIAHPAGSWLRSGAEASQKGKSKKSNSTIVNPPSPDSFNVRGKSGKKNDNIRRTPAP